MDTTTLFLFICIIITAASSPDKPIWPSQFKLPFGLNDPLFSISNASATLYYNYDEVQSQLLDYTTDCFPLIRWNARNHACKMFFNPKGIFVSMPELDIPCCLYVADVGAVPPSFLEGFTYSNHNESVPDQSGKKHSTYRWDGEEDFKYWTDIQTGDDVQFQDGPTGVKWNFGQMQVTAQNKSMFNLPSGDCTKKCNIFNLPQYNEVQAYSPFLALALKFYNKN